MRRVIIGVAVATTMMLGFSLSALPAGAMGPPVPAGCTFNGATGESTCVTMQETTSLQFSVTITDPSTPVWTTTAGHVGCGLQAGFVWGSTVWTAVPDAPFTVTAMTTTTTVHHGVSPHGHVVSQSSSVGQVLSVGGPNPFDVLSVTCFSA